MKMRIRFYIGLLPLFFLLSSCMDDGEWYEINRVDPAEDTLLNRYIAEQSGLFILNEGNLFYHNASLSYYFIDSLKVLNDVFFRANALPLGDVASSLSIRDSLAYIVVNNSGRIYAMDIRDFSLKGEITGLVSPRFIHFVGHNKAYVSDLYARSISIVDPVGLKLTGRIDVNNGNPDFYQHSTEKMVGWGNQVFVACWSYDNTILVVDSETDRVRDSITVVKQPVDMEMDRFGRLWVLSDGGYPGSPYGYEQPGLTRINPVSLEIEKLIPLEQRNRPTGIAMNGTGDTLYFINRDVYRLPVLSEKEPEIFIHSPYTTGFTSGFYGLAVDPFTSDVYVADAIDHVQRGTIYRYDVNGNLMDSFKAGIIPSEFAFRP